MLALLNFDSVSRPLLDRLMSEGRLPNVAELFRRGREHALDTPAERFPAAVYPSLYTGRHIGDHGISYTFLWSPSEQRVRYVDHFEVPPSVWETASAAGARVLIIDPYEAAVPRTLSGLCIAGWQLRNRVVLPGWSRPRDARRRLSRRFGRPPRVEEVLGSPSLAMLRATRRDLLAAPGRVATLARDLLARERFDLVWVTFSAAHLAGHQFWDLSQLSAADARTAAREGLDTTLTDVYANVDAAIGEIVDVLPDNADVVLFSPLGMGPNTFRGDLLPGMLRAVLQDDARDGGGAPGGVLWRLRGSVPTRLRAAVAKGMPRRAVLELTARLETRGVDWSTVRAFALPSDGASYIRLNIRGRERDGIVDPGDAETVADELVDGLSSFTDADGAPCVVAVERIRDVVPDATTALALPDLLVRWSNRATATVDRVASPTFGEVRRIGRGSGRSGNHTADGWAVVAGRCAAAGPTGDQRAAVVDVTATVAAACGATSEGLAGRPLFRVT